MPERGGGGSAISFKICILWTALMSLVIITGPSANAQSISMLVLPTLINWLININFAFLFENAARGIFYYFIISL